MNMRYIDLDEILLKRENWGNRIELWTAPTLKKDFREHFFGKCWYSEALLAGHDINIDHFRPKAAVKKFEEYHFNQDLENKGYYWLVNDPKNYRGCCVFANRVTGQGGKGSHFPLRAGSPCLSNCNCQNSELPLLIDPCNQQEVCLFTFLGADIHCASNNQEDIERVAVSKILYNLDDSDIRNLRVRVWDDVSKTLDEYSASEISEKACLRKLEEAIDKRSHYSACAIACVNSLAPDEIRKKLNLVL